MTDDRRSPSPAERRLDRPPSDRFRDPAPTATQPRPGATGSNGRAIAGGAIAGLVGSGTTIVLGGILGLSAGLLVVAGATGWAIGAATILGGGETVPRGIRARLAVTLAVVAVIVGQAGLWLYARAEGGVLDLPAYLGETFGLLVPVQAALAVGVAWWTAR